MDDLATLASGGAGDAEMLRHARVQVDEARRAVRALLAHGEAKHEARRRAIEVHQQAMVVGSHNLKVALQEGHAELEAVAGREGDPMYSEAVVFEKQRLARRREAERAQAKDTAQAVAELRELEASIAKQHRTMDALKGADDACGDV